MYVMVNFGCTMLLLTKVCNGCGVEKDLSAYHNRSDRPDGKETTCKECRTSKYRRKYTGIERDKQIEYSRQWRRNNPGYATRRYRKDRELGKAMSAARRAMKRGTSVGPVDYTAILQRDDMVCHICNEEVDAADVHYDHVIPLSRGGTHTEDNIKLSHSKCNLWKHARLMEELDLTKVPKCGIMKV